jgi:regulator of protease activity HflC (stomatin/prohibitin superfamily)
LELFRTAVTGSSPAIGRKFRAAELCARGVADRGIEATELGAKDVILPGEICELVNKVVEAERTAKANLIRRQEQIAATRSLLNTAKLMADNPLPLRLKELESLERLAEKVGRIDLHAAKCSASTRCSRVSCG